MKKNKKQLDALNTYEEFMQYRWKYLSKMNSYSSIDRQYLKELEHYCRIRFKDEEEKRFRRWEDDVKKKIGDETEIEAKQFITSFGFEKHYLMGIAHDLKEIGEFKFIQGIVHGLPEEEVKDMQKMLK